MSEPSIPERCRDCHGSMHLLSDGSYECERCGYNTEDGSAKTITRMVGGTHDREREIAAMFCNHEHRYEMKLKNVYHCEDCNNYFFWNKEADDRAAKKARRKAEGSS